MCYICHVIGVMCITVMQLLGIFGTVAESKMKFLSGTIEYALHCMQRILYGEKSDW